MRRAAFALTALALAVAFPMTWPSSREYAPSAEVVMMDARVAGDTDTAVAIPSATFTAGTMGTDDDATQTAAMMIVGTFLIAVGSMVRRVV